ncbi:LysR family transcriptional regulator [Nitratireductor luteus]|uniref:LysR family transcriptional regulator n=1 Tax=Nitratireductor luteus TaxID=2976980 RepID=UPI00223FC36D|nr:LysR family transcriptional regulator [Nitratireductor luteus]
MDDWNDLRLILAVRRAGSLTAAAGILGVDHSTVFRKLNAIEAKLGARLFERLPGGVYQATAPGERMAVAAERMESEVLSVDRDISGQDRRLSGRLVVTSSETLAYSRLTRHLAAFRSAHPGIVVELIIDNRVLSLSRREADVALRPTRPSEGDLWGKRLADVAWALYGNRDMIDAEDSAQACLAALKAHPVIGWDETAAGVAAAAWLARHAPPENVVYRTNSLVNQLIAAREGIGLALLPCYLGDTEPGMTRVSAESLPALTGELWIITHADLKATARVRAFFDIVGAGLARESRAFEGAAQDGAEG